MNQRRMLEKKARSDERFQVKVGDRGKLCPYCMQLVPLNTNLPQHADVVCPGYDGPGTNLPSAEVMRQKKERILVQSRLRMVPKWKLFDQENHWYCPYCTGNTGITKEGKLEDREAFTDAVLDHLRRCEAYDDPEDETEPKEEIKEAVEHNNREIELKNTVMERVEKGDEHYVQKTPDGRWVCPYCADVIKNIHVETEFLLLNSAPAQIASHLVHSCDPHRNGASMKPTDELRKAAEEHAEQRSGAPREGDESTRTPEVKELARELSELRSELDENKKIRKGLEDAGQVQKGLLPEEIPELKGFDLGTFYEPSSHLGGDFYDVVDLEDNRLGFALGDVAGHGVDSALIMGLTKKSLNIRSREGRSPKEVLSKVNVDILPEVNSALFITCVYGVLDLDDGTVELARAGHNYSLLYRASEDRVDEVSPKGVGLGIVGPNTFEEKVENTTFQLEQNDILFHYTDGLVEGVNDENEEFGIERVKNMIRATGTEEAAQELVNRTVETFQGFLGEKGQEDDLTIFALRQFDSANR